MWPRFGKAGGMLSDMGYEKADSKEEADIILLQHLLR